MNQNCDGTLKFHITIDIIVHVCDQSFQLIKSGLLEIMYTYNYMYTFFD